VPISIHIVGPFGLSEKSGSIEKLADDAQCAVDLEIVFAFDHDAIGAVRDKQRTTPCRPFLQRLLNATAQSKVVESRLTVPQA